ncbi:hypothetical protein, partial [Arthrobacter sp. yr096]|uniref:hypothetical protein n=1 Tax=Arthrobacter sp. yr096 TaxID=1761750 RepID=UPI001C43419A
KGASPASMLCPGPCGSTQVNPRQGLPHAPGAWCRPVAGTAVRRRQPPTQATTRGGPPAHQGERPTGSF